MVCRFLIAAGLCMAACALPAARSAPADVPIVIGESGDGAAAPAMILPDSAGEEAVPAQPPPVADAFVAEEALPEGEMFAPGPRAPCRACEPDVPDAYTTVDVLFIERTNTVGPLAVSSWFTDTPGAPVITAGDVRYPVSPGLRLFQGWRTPDCGGFEAGYLGVWGMHADALAVSPAGELAVPGVLGLDRNTGFGNATAIRPVLDSTLNSAEFNLFTTHTYNGCRRHDPLPWRRSWRWLEGTTATADWILGIRWAHLDESANLFVTATVPSTTDYRVTTSSQLFGPQFGHRRRLEWGDWAVEGWAKAGLMASILSQSQSAVVGPFDLVQIRAPQKASTAGMGMIGDLNASVVRRLGDHWGVRAGYTLLWLTGVAPAANQWDFTNEPGTSGTGVTKGTVFLHGATLGLEAHW